MADSDGYSSYGPQNLLKNTNPKARAAIAATFGAPSPKPSDDSDRDDKQAKIDAMKRRMDSGS